MYKSTFTLWRRRFAMGLFILIAGCGSSGNYHEEALEQGTETQNIDSDKPENATEPGPGKSAAYDNPDTNMMTRKLQPQDSSAVYKGNK